MANGQPKPTFYVAVFIVILGLVGLALYRYGAIGSRNQTGQISGDELNFQAISRTGKTVDSGVIPRAAKVKEVNPLILRIPAAARPAPAQ